MSFHRHFLELVEQIERDYPVGTWRCRDFELWPIARMGLYLDMYWAQTSATPPTRPVFPLRHVATASRLLRNLWRSRREPRRLALRARPADAVVLGDGVSFDWLDGEAVDRFGEPVMAAQEGRGQSAFLMQQGDLSRWPWHRTSYAANLIAYRGTPGPFSRLHPIHAPALDDVRQFLLRHEVDAGSMTAPSLTMAANQVAGAASRFESILMAVKPTLAFVVNYYSNLGPAFLLACRRRGILSIDLQHCPQIGTHQAYRWWAVPETGYATLPAIFWSWTLEDAAAIRHWTDPLRRPWHRSFHGGHIQLAPYLDDGDALAAESDRRFRAIGNGADFEREILVALQPVEGGGAWEALADHIRDAPATWRWWIRRHPASTPLQDRQFQRLFSLRAVNVVTEETAALPLPALLRHMSVIISLFSGAAVEAAEFGVPALFLSDEARGRFPELFAHGLATVCAPQDVGARIGLLPGRPQRPPPQLRPGIAQSLERLQEMAGEYAGLCREFQRAARES